MRVAILGRTGFLLETAKLLHQSGYDIAAIITAKAEKFYDVTEEDFASYSEEIQVPFYRGIKNSETQKKLLQSEIDVAVSVNWPFILSEKEISLFKKGILNGHIGDLPRYRGNACPNWAILKGESQVGLSIHFMEADEVDSGDVLVKSYLDVSHETYISDIYRDSEQLFPKMFLDAVKNLSDPEFQPLEQAQSGLGILRTYPRRPEDSLIHWGQDAVNIHRLIRASSKPFSGAFCYLEANRKVSILKASVFKFQQEYFAMPGQVLGSKDGLPMIACGKGELLLEEVDFEDGSDAKPEILKSLRNRLTSCL